MNNPTARTLARTLKQHRARLLNKAHVVGVGVGEKITAGRPTGRICLKVYVEKKVEKAALSKQDLVPGRVATIETDVEEVGKIRPLAYTQRMRPAPAGCSIGHYKITAGTLGCVVEDRRTGRPLMLSNNHVLANANHAKPGDAVIQPGAADGGRRPKDTVGALERWVEITFTRRPNAVDCAVARPVEDATLTSRIIGNGTPKGLARAARGLVVQKTGRTTEFTMGKVRDVSATVKVAYAGKTAVFEHQILTSAMGQGGDSGSLITDQHHRAVGLLFAGSDVVTIANPIPAVFESLGVRLSTRPRAGGRPGSGGDMSR